MLHVPIDKIVPLTTARDTLSKIIADVESGTPLYVLTKNGKPSVAVLSINELQNQVGQVDLASTTPTTPPTQTAPPTPEPNHQAPTPNFWEPTPSPTPATGMATSNFQAGEPPKTTKIEVKTAFEPNSLQPQSKPPTTEPPAPPVTDQTSPDEPGDMPIG